MAREKRSLGQRIGRVVLAVIFGPFVLAVIPPLADKETDGNVPS